MMKSPAAGVDGPKESGGRIWALHATTQDANSLPSPFLGLRLKWIRIGEYLPLHRVAAGADERRNIIQSFGGSRGHRSVGDR